MFCARTEGVDRNHSARVVACREAALYASFVLVAVDERESARLVVGCNNDECLAVFCRPLHHLTNGLVEVERLLHEHIELVEVSVVVELRAFDHHEEALLVAVHQFDALHRRTRKQVAALVGQRSVLVVRHGKDVAVGVVCEEVVERTRNVIALHTQFVEDVASVLAVGELLRTTAEHEVDTTRRIVADEFFFLVAVDVMAAEITGRSVPQTACDGDARILAKLLRHVYERCQRLAFGVDAYGMVAGLYARSERCTARTGVGYELVGCPSLRQSGGCSVLEPQFSAVGCPRRVDVHEAHAVANHQYYVLHLFAFRCLYLLNGVWFVVCEGLCGHVVLCAGCGCAYGKSHNSK